MTEILRDLRRNLVPVVVKALVVALLFLCGASLLSFSRSTASAIDSGFSSRSEVNLYNVIDTLTDADEFFEFRQSPARVASLARFYNDLNTSTRVAALSMFNQAVPIENFRGDDSFDYGYGTDMEVKGKYIDPTTGVAVQDVKSLQLNRHAFEFFGLTVDSGNAPPWSEIDYSSGRVPVLLGSDYRGLYELGDTIRGSLYFSPLNFTVVGFLAPESAVYFQGEMNTFLDHTMVVPYPETLTADPAQPEFTGILTFAMANTGLAAPKQLSPDAVLSELQRVSDRSGFTDYSLQGVPDYLVQFALVRQLILDNRALLVTTQILLAVGTAVASVFISAYLRDRRAPQTRVFWLLGFSRHAIAVSRLRLWTTEYLLTVVVFLSGSLLIPGLDPRSTVPVLALLLVWIGIDALVQLRLLRRSPHLPLGKERTP